MYQKENINKYILLIIILSSVCSLISGYLFYNHYLTDNASIFSKLCSFSGIFDCKKINTGDYSTFLGFPIAGYGLAWYLSVLIAMLFLYAFQNKPLATLIINLLFYSSLLALITILPLFFVSLFIIKNFCSFCIITWIGNIFIFMISVLIIKHNRSIPLLQSLRTDLSNSFKIIKSFNNIFPELIFPIITLVLLFTSILFAFKYLNLNHKFSKLQNKIQMENEIISKFYGQKRFSIDLNEIPIFYGNPEAKVSIVVYFDFFCGICHKAINKVQHIENKYRGKVKIFLKNYPLDAACNPSSKKSYGGYSCKAASISILLRGDKKYYDFINYFMKNKSRSNRHLLINAIEHIESTEEELMFDIGRSYIKKILAEEVQEGHKLGVNATPTLIINGKVLPSGLPPSAFLERIIKMVINGVHAELSNN